MAHPIHRFELIFCLIVTPSLACCLTLGLVDITPGGVQAIGACNRSSISFDGRFIAFDSQAINFQAGATNGLGQIYVKDMSTGALECVSLNSIGQVGNGVSGLPSISWDGRYVSFLSAATNLLQVSPAVDNVFIYDRLSKTIELVNVSFVGGHNLYGAGSSSISGDGRYVAFSGNGNDLISTPINSITQAYVRDRLLSTTELIGVPEFNSEVHHLGT